jgi:PAS domain S-box-containing protein
LKDSLVAHRGIFLAGGGGMGERMRTYEWSTSPLGPPARWAQPLKTLVAVMLAANQPMFIAWGAGRTMLYNDGYAEILGLKHPEAFGQPFDQVWSEIWGELEPIMARCYAGEPIQMDDITLVMHRHSYPEETHFAFSYTPVRDEAGQVAGVFCPCTEITAKVLADRRQAFRLGLEEGLRDLSDPRQAMAAAAEALGRHLDAAQVGYAEVDADGYATTGGEFHDGRIPSFRAGRYHLNDYGPAIAADMAAGHAIVVHDVREDIRTSFQDALAAYAAISLRAFVIIPLVKGGRLTAYLYVAHPETRRWSDDDLTLAHEVAERTWAAVERGRAEAALRESEARWRGLFESMHEGFALAQMVYGANGQAVDHRFLAVNEAWERHVGLPQSRAVGRLISDILPGGEHAFWVDIYARVNATGHPERVEQYIPTFRRWVAMLAYRADPGRIACLVTDVTERKAAEERRDALLDLGDRLRDLRDPAEIAHTAAEVIGRPLGAARAGYGTVDAAGENFRVERDWTDARMASSAGNWWLTDFWTGFADELRRGETIAVDDVSRDPRTAGRADGYLAMEVRAFVNVPVVEAGRVVAILYVQNAATRRWAADEVAFVREAAERTWAAVDRARAEERQALLSREVDHRAKNALAVVQAALRLTKAPDLPSYIRAVEGRIGALARAQTLLADDRWAGADLQTLLQGELAPFLGAPENDREAVSSAGLDGPSVTLPPGMAQPLAMAIHELATNAVKHGALSSPAGRISVSWRLARAGPAGAPLLRLRWAEAGGPPVPGPPERPGFGSRVIKGTVQGQLGGSVSLAWEALGLVCDIKVPLARTAAPAPGFQDAN